MAELIARHWQEGMTVLLLARHARLEPPFAVPRDMPYRNIVLLINDVDHYCTSTALQEQTTHLASESGQEPRQELSSTESRHFKYRLQAAIEYFEHIAGAAEVRVVATVRKDELSWNAIQFEKDEFPWKTFNVFNLDDVPQRTAGTLIQWLAKETGIEVPDDIRSALAVKNAGTFTNLILAFRDWKLEGVQVLGQEHVAEFEGSLSDTFHLKYKRAVAANPLNQYLYAALDVLRALSIAPHRYLVEELATRMAGDRPVLATRRVQSLLRHSYERTEDTITHSNLIRAITARYPKLGSRLVRGFIQVGETRLGKALGRYLRYGSETDFSKAGGSKVIQKALQQLTETEIPIQGDMLVPIDGQVDGFGKEWMDSETVAGLLTEHASADDSFIYSLISLAERLAEDHDYQAAVPLLDKAIQLAPRYPYARRERVRVLWALERHEDSLADVDACLELDPRDPAAYAQKAMTLQWMHRHEEAILLIDKAISLVPFWAWLYEWKGDILRNQGLLPQAHAAYDIALSLDPKRCWTYGTKAIAFRFEGKLAEALKLLDNGIAIKPTEDWLWAQRGVVLGKMENYVEALASLDKAIALDPKIAWFHGHRGWVLRRLKRYDDTLAAFDQAVALDPKDSWLYLARSRDHRNMSQFEQALSDINQALEIKPEDDWSIYCRAVVFLASGKTALAQADLAEAIRLAEVHYGEQPTDWQNTFNLALYHLANNEAAEAESLYREGIAGNATLGHIRDAVGDLDDLATVIPDSGDVSTMRTLLASVQPSAQNSERE